MAENYSVLNHSHCARRRASTLSNPMIIRHVVTEKPHQPLETELASTPLDSSRRAPTRTVWVRLNLCTVVCYLQRMRASACVMKKFTRRRAPPFDRISRVDHTQRARTSRDHVPPCWRQIPGKFSESLRHRFVDRSKCDSEVPTWCRLRHHFRTRGSHANPWAPPAAAAAAAAAVQACCHACKPWQIIVSTETCQWPTVCVQLCGDRLPIVEREPPRRSTFRSSFQIAWKLDCIISDNGMRCGLIDG